MTRIELQTDFLIAHYYHAAKDAAEVALKSQMPDSMQHAIVGLIMSQCALEGYINFQIHLRDLEAHKVTIQRNPDDKPKTKKLAKVSIRDKWAHLPIIISGRNWIINEKPFKYFAELVNYRNDLVHFNADKFTHSAIAPKTLSTPGDLKSFTKDGKWLRGSKLDQLIRMGIAGHLIVRDMIVGLHKLLGTATPNFLASEKILFSVKLHQAKQEGQP